MPPNNLKVKKVVKSTLDSYKYKFRARVKRRLDH